MRTPLVSVTVTNYNYARFLARNIESILAQNFTDFEVIVIDNASTDASIDIIKDFVRRDPRIRLIAHEVKHSSAGSFANPTYCGDGLVWREMWGLAWWCSASARERSALLSDASFATLSGTPTIARTAIPTRRGCFGIRP